MKRSRGTQKFKQILSEAECLPLAPSGSGELLSADQKRLVDAALEGKNVFVTGSAGTGKSFVFRHVIDLLKAKYPPNTVYVTASTGIAATPLGGITLHGYAGVGLGEDTVEVILTKLEKNKPARDRWQKTRVLIVDEISMVSPAFFSKLDRIGRAVRSRQEMPFGGIQLVLAGDFFQLPPVVKGPGGANGMRFVFETDAWKQAVTTIIELTEIFRQTNSDFVSLLQRVRRGAITDEDHKTLLSRLNVKLPSTNGILPTRLHTHRKSVDSDNEKALAALPGEEVSFVAVDDKIEKAAYDQLQKNCLAPANLVLKRGAQVMLLKNLNPPHLVNGSRGIVIDFIKNKDGVTEPQVLFDNGLKIVVEKAVWKIERHKNVVVAMRTQTPLCLAWAFSVHKCQGMTIDKAEIDISGCWDPGQAYVALSRCTSLEGMRLLGYNRFAIKASDKVKEFYQSLAPRAIAAPLGPPHQIPAADVSCPAPLPGGGTEDKAAAKKPAIKIQRVW